MTAGAGSMGAGSSNPYIFIDATCGNEYAPQFQKVQNDPDKCAQLAIKILVDNSISQEKRVGCLQFINNTVLSKIKEKLTASYENIAIIQSLIAKNFEFAPNVPKAITKDTLHNKHKLNNMLNELTYSIDAQQEPLISAPTAKKRKVTESKTAPQAPSQTVPQTVSQTTSQTTKKDRLSTLPATLLRHVGSFLKASDRVKIPRLHKAKAQAYAETPAALIKGDNEAVSKLIKKAMKSKDGAERKKLFDYVTDAGTTITSLNLRNMQNLDLDFFKWLVSSFPNLQNLNLSSTDVNDKGLTILLKLKSTLKEIELSSCSRLTDTGFSQLEHFQNLQHLNLRNSQINDSGLLAVSKLPKLLDLNLQDCFAIPPHSFQHLVQLKNLEKLTLQGTSLGNNELQAICRLERLRELDVSSCLLITYQGLYHLAELHHLQKLRVANTYLNNSGLQAIGKLTTLTDLDVSLCKDITSEGIAFLTPLEKLERLNLSGTWIDDAAIVHLLLIKNLKNLMPSNKMTQEGRDILEEHI